MKIRGGTGDDTFAVADTLPASAIVIDGGGGMNTLIIDDRAEAAAQTYDITSTSITRTGAGPLGYSDFSGLVLDIGSAADVIDVGSTAAGTGTDVYGGSGDDVYAVTGDSTLDGIIGPVNIHGGAGANTLAVGGAGMRLSSSTTPAPRPRDRAQ